MVKMLHIEAAKIHLSCHAPPGCDLEYAKQWLNHSDLMICYNVDCGEGSRKVGMARHVTHELETLGCKKTI